MDKLQAQKIANHYLQERLGANYCVNNGFVANQAWYFLIKYRTRNDSHWSGYGQLIVDVESGSALALSNEQKADILELTQERLGELDGVSRLTAIRTMNGYLTEQLSLFAVPERPIYVGDEPPLWRSYIALNVPKKEPLPKIGTISVHVKTGEVIPLTEKQVISIRTQANNAAASCQTPASAATG